MRGLIAAALLLVALPGAHPASAAAHPAERRGNPYGVMLGMGGGDASDFASLHFGWASELVGDWGHVRVGSGIDKLDIEGAVRTLAICRAKHLIPVMSGLYVPREYQIPGGQDCAAYLRDDGYPLAAEHYRKWAARLAALGAQPPYFELGNEINGKWDPEAYGRFIIAVSKALKSELPGIKMVSAGLAGNGADFLDQMLTAVPEAADYIDCWGLHPYGANHPPAYDLDGYCLKGHLWTAQALAKHGITDPRFVMTESGYELGDKKDHRYPRITDELRAQYLVEAYETIWAPDPRVVTLTLFMLQSVHYPTWHGWVLIRDDCTKTKTFEALAAVPKPPGHDWMPQGPARVEGRVIDAESGMGLERVFVYTVPGIYAAETGPDGRFVIEGLPEGAYTVRYFRDGFLPAGEFPQVSATRAESPRLALRMKRVGFVKREFTGRGRVVDGWLPTAAKPSEQHSVDPTVRRLGPVSQRLDAAPGRSVGIWICTGYATAVPDRAYAGEVWVKGKGVKRGKGGGASFTLSVTDSFAHPLSSAKVTLPLDGDFDWTPLSATVAPVPEGRRLVLTCSFEAEEGTVWFADPYCHYADYPVPSRAMLPARGSGSIEGELIGPADERIPGAVVALRPGNVWTTSRSDGRYTLGEVPPGVYDLWVFHRDWASAASFGLLVRDGASLRCDVHLAKPPAPRQLVNPGFEEGGPEISVLPGWTRFGEFDGIARNGWHAGLPEHPQGFRARTGQGFAGSVAGSNVKNGGILQTLEVEPGKTYEAGVWVYTYQTEDGVLGDVASRLGLDPTGGRDPGSPYVIWTPLRPSHKEWTHLTISALAVSDRMTVFLEAKQIVGRTFVVNLFDDVTFHEIPFPLPPAQTLGDPGVAARVKRGGTRSAIFQPRHLWGFTAPGADPTEMATADDVGPYWSIRERYIRDSGATYVSVTARWADAEPQPLPGDNPPYDWTAFDRELDRIPPRMAAMCSFDLSNPWADELAKRDEAEYWRLAERFMEHASRRAHARGVLYYTTPGNEPSLTMRPDWAEWYMKPVRHIARAVHRGHPDNQVIAGALVVGDRPRIEALYQHGFKEHVDVLDIHAYANSPGEKRYYVGLSQVLESHQVLAEHGDAHKRIFLGEGWSVFPLPPHIDHLKAPPVYTEEDFAHYRKTVVYGFRALTTPRPGEYDPDWLLGARFFCLNDLWGSLGWARRAKIEYNEFGDPAFWLLDGYKFPYAPGMMDPQFRTWGLIDINGYPKGDIVFHFPPYIPRHAIEVSLGGASQARVVPGRRYPVEVTLWAGEPEPFSNMRFSMDLFRGGTRHDCVRFHPVGGMVPSSLPMGQCATYRFELEVAPDQVGRQVVVQGGCEFDWEGEPYYVDDWLTLEVASPGSFTLLPYQALAPSTDDPVRVLLQLDDVTGAQPPETLRVEVPDGVTVRQRSEGRGPGARVYELEVRKEDTSAGGFYKLTASAGAAFEPITVHVAFPNPGHRPEQYPARGRLINGGFEEYGPGSGFEGWEGEPNNWDAPDQYGDLPGVGKRLIQTAWHGTKYRREYSQVVLVPEGFRAGGTVTVSASVKGVAPAEATDHEAVRFRIGILFLDGQGRELRRDDSPLYRGTGAWERVEFTSGGAPEGTAAVKIVLMLENINEHGWHMAFIDNVELEFGR